MAHWYLEMTEKLDEWGIPDHTEVSNYGDTSRWDMNRWRWEFLRRRDDYRAAFAAAVKDVSDPLLCPEDVMQDQLAYFPKLRSWPFFHEAAQVFDLQEFFDPVQSNWFNFGPWWSETGLLPGDCSDERDGLVALTFDLSRPLKAQLEEARKELEACYASHWYDDEKDDARPVRAMKRRPEKWLTYLRLLDAKARGASLSQMAELLPPEMGRRDARAAGNVLDQAEAQAFRF